MMRLARAWSPMVALTLCLTLEAACGPATRRPPASVHHGASSTASATTVSSPPAVSPPLTQGLIAFLGRQGVGVVEPRTADQLLLEAAPTGSLTPRPGATSFQNGTRSITGGPVWVTPPGASTPVLYFSAWWCCSDTGSPAAAWPYVWLLAGDPFAGTLRGLSSRWTFSYPVHELLAVSSGQLVEAVQPDQQATVTIQPLDGQGRASAVSPPQGDMLWLEGVAPSGRWVVTSATWLTDQVWSWLDPRTGATEPFPLPSTGATQGTFFRFPKGDGAIAVSPDGNLMAMALPIGSQPNSGGEIALDDLHAKTGWSILTSSLAAPPTSLAWSPDGRQLAAAVNGDLWLLNPSAEGGAPRLLVSGAGITDISWSEALPAETMAALRTLPDFRSVVRSITLPLGPQDVVLHASVPLQALVTDGYGHPVPGVPVMFQAQHVCPGNSGGYCPMPYALSPVTATTDAQGGAAVKLTATETGPGQLTASAAGVQVNQALMVLPSGDSAADVPAKVEVTADPQQVTVGQSARLEATVTNSAGAAVAKAPVFFSWPGGPQGLVTTTDTRGHAEETYRGPTGSQFVDVFAAPPGLEPQNGMSTAQGTIEVTVTPAPASSAPSSSSMSKSR